MVTSKLGITHRKKRPADVEVETGLLAIAHNLAKMAN